MKTLNGKVAVVTGVSISPHQQKRPESALSEPSSPYEVEALIALTPKADDRIIFCRDRNR